MENRKLKAGEYSKHQYEVNNKWGIDRITSYLKSRGFNVHDKAEEDYDVDIIADKGGHTFKYEAEVKTGYSFTCKEDYRFDTVSFLGRKKKYHTRNKNGFYYCIVCKETESIVYCHSSDIYKDEYKIIRQINTSHRQGTDEFYLVPKNICSFVNMSSDASL